MQLIERLEVARQDELNIQASVSARMQVDPQTAFDFVTDEDVLPTILTGYGLVPGVSHTSGLSGDWHLPGTHRIVHLKGGGQAREEMSEFVPPHHFEYVVSEFTISLRHLVRYGVGRWMFRPASNGGVHIDWTYAFTARGPLAAMALEVVVRHQWVGYMRRSLENMNRVLTTGR
jgi:hypothetical protein